MWRAVVPTARQGALRHNRGIETWKVRRAANWVNLSTPLGLAVARLGRTSVCKGARGIYLATEYAYAFPIASAFTVGSVVVTQRSLSWLESRPRLMAHEERHAWQYVACGGLPFLPLYLAAMAYSQWRTGDRAATNVFERLAGLSDAGYRVPSVEEVVATRRRRRALAWRVVRLIGSATRVPSASQYG